MSNRSRPKRRRVTFRLNAPEAHTVALCGDFNDWEPDALPMRPQENGDWTRAKMLPAGVYQYRFVVDGEWVNPPGVETTPNEYGGENCVRRV